MHEICDATASDGAGCSSSVHAARCCHTMLYCAAHEHRYHLRQYLWAKLLFLVTAAYYLDRVGRLWHSPPSNAVERLPH